MIAPRIIAVVAYSLNKSGGRMLDLIVVGVMISRLIQSHDDQRQSWTLLMSLHSGSEQLEIETQKRAEPALARVLAPLTHSTLHTPVSW